MRVCGRAICFVLTVSFSANWTANATEVPAVAFFGFQLINTSLEPTTAAENDRARMLDELFEQRIGNSEIGRAHV